MRRALRTPASFGATIRSMKAIHRLQVKLAFALCASLTAALAAAQGLQVIELRHRTAPEVIPVLQPLLEPGGALTGKDYTLFVRASGANVAQLRQALAQLDRAPRQLLVSVRRASEQQIESERLAASGTMHSADAAASVNEPPARRSGASVRATDDSVRSEVGGSSTVQVMEGGSAFIATGTSVPIVTTVAAGGGRRPWAASSTSYRDVASGFTVTPRVNGEIAMLQIEQQQEGVQRGRVETQRLTTQLSAKLGEWVRLGGVSESATSEQRGILTRTRQTRSDDLSLWVRVEVSRP
jgi:type II secretory pathway component GspD/PulD (secretin)